MLVTLQAQLQPHLRLRLPNVGLEGVQGLGRLLARLVHALGAGQLRDDSVCPLLQVWLRPLSWRRWGLRCLALSTCQQLKWLSDLLQLQEAEEATTAAGLSQL